jgi:hypothetical protein
MSVKSVLRMTRLTATHREPDGNGTCNLVRARKSIPLYQNVQVKENGGFRFCHMVHLVNRIPSNPILCPHYKAESQKWSKNTGLELMIQIKAARQGGLEIKVPPAGVAEPAMRLLYPASRFKYFLMQWTEPRF